MKDSILEIIGMNAIVTESSDNDLVGVSGLIVDETKHMLKLNTKFGERLIPKKTCMFKISRYNNTYTISGTKLHNRSHERLEVIT